MHFNVYLFYVYLLKGILNCKNNLLEFTFKKYNYFQVYFNVLLAVHFNFT